MTDPRPVPRETPGGDASDRGDTSFHARRVLAGDLASLDWLVRRLSPLLVAQADRRLGSNLRRFCDPEDLVAEVWLDALPRLGSLDSTPRHHAAVVVRYLSTMLLGKVRNLARKAATRTADTPPGAPLSEPAADTTGVVSGAVRAERRGAVWTALAELPPEDRDVVIFRGIEQRSPREVAVLMGLSEPHAVVRYHRALTKLRAAIPGSVFEDLPDAEGS